MSQIRGILYFQVYMSMLILFHFGKLMSKLMSFLSEELLGPDNAPRSVFEERNVNGTNTHKSGTDSVEVSIYFHTVCI